MTRVGDWDELNIIRSGIRIPADLPQGAAERKRFCDWLEYVLCLIYGYGWEDAAEVVGPLPEPGESMDRAVHLEIEGKTFRERAEEHLIEQDVEALIRLIDTEAMRDYNTGVLDGGIKSGKRLNKRWCTCMDERVRDTHDYLEGAVVGLEDRFYTFDGDSALQPLGFSNPANNINCRCWIVLSPA